jgi:hypothetical protein
MLFLTIPFTTGFIVLTILSLVAGIVLLPILPAIGACLSIDGILRDLFTMVITFPPALTFLGRTDFLFRMIW